MSPTLSCLLSNLSFLTHLGAFLLGVLISIFLYLPWLFSKDHQE